MAIFEKLKDLEPKVDNFKKPKNQEQIKNDPFLLLGYGVNAYFSTMMHIAKMFAVISIFMIPVLYIYSKNET